MEKLNSFQKNAFMGIFVILLYFVWPTIAEIPLQILEITSTEQIGLGKVLYDLATNLSLLCLIVWIYRKSIKRDIEDFKKNRKKIFLIMLQYTILAFIGIFLVSAVRIFIFHSDNTANDVALYTYFKEVPWLMTIMAIFYYPIVEEFVFKKTLKTIIQKKWLFIITSALFFGYFNVAFTNMTVLNVMDTLPYIVFAFVTAHAYYKTDNILVPIGIKMIYNIVVTMMLI